MLKCIDTGCMIVYNYTRCFRLILFNGKIRTKGGVIDMKKIQKITPFMAVLFVVLIAYALSMIVLVAWGIASSLKR